MSAIHFADVTLWRRTQEEFAYDLKGSLFRLLEMRYRPASRRCTINNVELKIERGEKVALIGRNGSGKSTLLKLAAGIIPPSHGSVSVDGKVTALIELGAGFDPDLTLVDNILYYGVLLGYSQADMKKRLADILRFAELENYASAPLKTLSSGMTARLSFAIATDVRPDILLIDEVLSVGDEAFRNKSVDRIRRFWDERLTIILVSHDLAFIAGNCDRAIILDAGEVVADGPVAEIIAQYMEDSEVTSAERFGAEAATLKPAIGVLDTVSIENGVLNVSGWGYIDAANRGEKVGIFVNGERVAEVPFSTSRPDVAAIFDVSRDDLGFSASIPITVAGNEHRVEGAVFDAATSSYRPIEHVRFVRRPRTENGHDKVPAKGAVHAG